MVHPHCPFVLRIINTLLLRSSITFFIQAWCIHRVRRMHRQPSILLVVFLVTQAGHSWSLPRHDPPANNSGTNECCVSAKLNVGSKKANQGREFFHQLATDGNAYKQINPENMCSLVHFLIQQAAMNNKSVTFTKGTYDTAAKANNVPADPQGCS